MKYNLRSKLYLRNEKNENLRIDFIALEEIFRKNIKIAARIIYHTLRWKSAFSREFFNKDIYNWLYEYRGRKLDEFMFVVNIIQIFSLVHIEYSQLSTLTFSLSSFVLIFTRFSLSSIILQVSVTIERKTVPQEIDSFWDDKHDRTRGQTSVLIKWRIKQNVERNMDKRNGIRKKKRSRKRGRRGVEERGGGSTRSRGMVSNKILRQKRRVNHVEICVRTVCRVVISFLPDGALCSTL